MMMHRYSRVLWIWGAALAVAGCSQGGVANENPGERTTDAASDAGADGGLGPGDGGSRCLGTDDGIPGDPDAAVLGDAAAEGDGAAADGAVADAGCPEEMVLISADEARGVSSPFCMDRYEASRRDATAQSGGADETIALSRAGVIPWSVNPMSAEALTLFENACIAAGKRICTREEWAYSCGGRDGSAYVYGDDFDSETCNSVATYCDDFCLAEGIPMETCNLSSNCGYACGDGSVSNECFHVDPTGSYPRCTNGFGTFDVNGNLWEVVPSADDSRGYEVRGGAFNCASPSTRFRCDYNAGWDSLNAGFRCCKDLPSA